MNDFEAYANKFGIGLVFHDNYRHPFYKPSQLYSSASIHNQLAFWSSITDLNISAFLHRFSFIKFEITLDR